MFTDMCISLCTTACSIHNTAPNNSDNLPSDPPDSHHSSYVVYCGRGRTEQSVSLTVSAGERQLVKSSRRFTAGLNRWTGLDGTESPPIPLSREVSSLSIVDDVNQRDSTNSIGDNGFTEHRRNHSRHAAYTDGLGGQLPPPNSVIPQNETYCES